MRESVEGDEGQKNSKIVESRIERRDQRKAM